MKVARYQPQQRTDTFLHTNYFRYAAHKLKACEHLVAHLGEFHDASLENKVCHELFYLMGYIVEGLSVYTIYEYVGWDKNREISWPDSYVEDTYDLSFSGRTKYTIKTHKFNTYLSVVRGKDEVSDIPFISGSDRSNTSYALLTKWSPELRYNLNIVTLRKQQICELCVYCQNMFNAVVETFGIPS